MKKRIEELVDKAIDERPLSKAVGLLERLRKQCDPEHAFFDGTKVQILTHVLVRKYKY
jgi:hypothetical protein